MSAPISLALASLCRRLRAGPRAVVAVSGGPDSQALLWLAAMAARQVHHGALWAVGVDHGTRPEAARELACASRLAARLEVPFVSRAVTLEPRGNRLAAARRARYAALEEELRARGAHWLLLGHTQTDRAETLLWHLFRGSAAAACAALPRRRGRHLRPLYDVDRPTVLELLEREGIAWAQDPSNAEPARMRARMRAHLWPALAAMGAEPAALCRGFLPLRRDQRLLDAWALRWLGRARRQGSGAPALHLPSLRRAPRALWPRIVRHFVLPLGGRPSALALDVLCERLAVPVAPRPGRAPRQHALAGLPLAWEEPWLWAAGAAGPIARPLLAGGSPWAATLGPTRVRATVLPSLGPTPAARRQRLAALGVMQRTGAKTVAFAQERLHVALRLRAAGPSEWIDAHGAKGRVTVAALLAQANVPKPARPNWPVVATPTEVVWVVGIRRGKQATIDVERDEPVVWLEAEPLEPDSEP